VSPFLTRIANKTVPVADLTGQVAAPQTMCSFCGAGPFVSPTNRNLHLMKRHADRRISALDLPSPFTPEQERQIAEQLTGAYADCDCYDYGRAGNPYCRACDGDGDHPHHCTQF
jgi:hypothetical protein